MPEAPEDPLAGLSPRTRKLLQSLFPEDAGTRWLLRHNPGFGCDPLRLVAQGREPELQHYLSRWLQPAETPPAPFESLFSDPGAAAR